MAWYDDEYKIKNIVRDITTPKLITEYAPGKEGFLQPTFSTVGQERSRKPPTALSIAPGEEQSRLEQLEYYHPEGYGTTAPTSPMSALPIGATTAPDLTQTTGVADEWKTKFDETVRTLGEPSRELEMLRNMAQGFGLPMGRAGREARTAAVQALKDIETNRRTALTSLAQTMTQLIMKPAEMQKDIWGKQLEHGLGSRRAALEEQRLAWEKERFPMMEAGKKAPATAVDTAVSTAPWRVREGETLIDPTTGKVIYEGKHGSKLPDKLSELAYRDYTRELKEIDEDILLKPEQQEERRQKAYEKMQKQFERFGRSEFAGGAVGEGEVPSREAFRQKVKAMYPNATPEQIDYEYEKAYGGKR